MSEMSEARTRIGQANEATQELRRRLNGLHVELLELERFADRTNTGMLVIDRADELRRHLSGSVQELTQGIRPALESTELAYFAGAISGEVDPGHARTMTGVVLQAAREARHLQLSIHVAARSLQQIVSASPADPWFPERLNRSVQHSAAALDHARRGAHRVGEDLPMVARSLSVDIASQEVADHLSIASLADRRQDPVTSARRATPMAAPVIGRGVTP